MGLLNDFAKDRVLAVQEFTLMSTRAIQNIFRAPHYMTDVVRQMDFIGFGSLPIVTGPAFHGAVLACRCRTLERWRDFAYGQIVSSAGARVGRC